MAIERGERQSREEEGRNDRLYIITMCVCVRACVYKYVCGCVVWPRRSIRAARGLAPDRWVDPRRAADNQARWTTLATGPFPHGTGFGKEQFLSLNRRHHYKRAERWGTDWGARLHPGEGLSTLITGRSTHGVGGRRLQVSSGIVKSVSGRQYMWLIPS